MLEQDDKKCFELMRARGQGEPVQQIEEQNGFGHLMRGDPFCLKYVAKWAFKQNNEVRK